MACECCGNGDNVRRLAASGLLQSENYYGIRTDHLPHRFNKGFSSLLQLDRNDPAANRSLLRSGFLSEAPFLEARNDPPAEEIGMNDVDVIQKKYRSQTPTHQ